MESFKEQEVCQCEFDKTTKLLQDFVQNVSKGNNESRKLRLKDILQDCIELLPSNSTKSPSLVQKQENHSNLLKLPNEIWMKIMTYLENKDLFSRCGN